jgi:pyridoxine 4-dehydrogenase
MGRKETIPPSSLSYAIALPGIGSVGTARSALEVIAKKHNATPSQIALAWLLKRNPVMLPTPGTSKVRHLEENAAAANIQLSDQDFAALDAAGKAE